MVDNLIQKPQNNGRSRSIDITALGDVANQSASTEKVQKPVIMQPVKAEILDIDLRVQNQINTNKDDASKKFHPCVLTIKTKFNFLNPETNKEEEYVSRDNYSGLRFFFKADDYGNPILDVNGEEQCERLWLGDKSDLGKLLAKAQEFDKSIVSYQDFFNFLASHKDCMIKTEYRNNPSSGEQTSKEIIQSFI